MRNPIQLSRSITILGFVACLLGTSPIARADEAKTNACGCHQTLSGECICTKRGKCGCPGECEPKGCEEKRQKELDKEIKAETEKAQAAEKKRQEEAAEKRKAEEQAAAAADEDTDDATDSAQQGQGDEGSSEAKGKAKSKGKGKTAKGKKDEKAPAAAKS